VSSLILDQYSVLELWPQVSISWLYQEFGDYREHAKFLSEKTCHYWNRKGITTYQYELNLEFISLILGEDHVLLGEIDYLCINGMWEEFQIA
ncbi:uncharacterized protein METZ01_LOCUS264303, partial [marine metagenome]